MALVIKAKTSRNIWIAWPAAGAPLCLNEADDGYVQNLLLRSQLGAVGGSIPPTGATDTVSAPEYFIQWSQLHSGIDFDSTFRSPSSLPGKPNLPIPSFTELLSPLGKGVCPQTIQQVKLQLQAMSRTLMLLSGQTFDATLQDMLEAFTAKVGEILSADRATVFLADTARQELWSTVPSLNAPHHPVEVCLPWEQGIAGEVARTRQTVNVPFDFYEDPRSEAAKRLEAKTGYRTYTLLALPVINNRGELLAVVELLNKCCSAPPIGSTLAQRIDPAGFGVADEATFAEFSDVFQLMLECSRAFYLAARRQKAATVLSKATQALNHSDVTLNSTLEWVIREAQHLLDADRSTVWLFDRDRRSLWTKIPLEGERAETIRVSVGQGYVGKVAALGTVLNVPFDLYQDPDCETARAIDQLSGYRTYSLLCMPVFDSEGRLIAVTQLLNKHRGGNAKPAPTAPSGPIPDCFRASFGQEDEFHMLAFNIHAGIAIERALLYESLEAKVAERTQELQLKNQQLQQEIHDRILAQEELKEVNQQLATMARIDALTQISNRREFDQHIETEWRRMRRLEAPLSLILCDIDFFKRYNDRYGHPAGDDCLRQVAAAMGGEIKRSGDLLARYGGEEFAIILPNTKAEGALHVAETLRKRILSLAVPHEDSAVHTVVTLSLGAVTCIPKPPHTYQELIQQTDEALYQAKQQGRNRTVVWIAF